MLPLLRGCAGALTRLCHCPHEDDCSQGHFNDGVPCQEEIDTIAVQLLSEDDLSFLGVSHSAHRRAILRAAARLAQEQCLLQPPHQPRQAVVQARESCQLQEGNRKRGRDSSAASARSEPLQRVSRGTSKTCTAKMSTYSRQAELRLLGALYPPPAGSSLREAALSPGGFVCGQQGPLSGCSEPQEQLPPHRAASAGHLACEDTGMHRPRADACRTTSAPVLGLQGGLSQADQICMLLQQPWQLLHCSRLLILMQVLCMEK